MSSSLLEGFELLLSSRAVVGFIWASLVVAIISVYYHTKSTSSTEFFQQG